MVGYGFFQTSTLAMRSQAHALGTIGQNVANVNTGGFKRTDTHFETILSNTLGKNMSDLGGVKPKDYQTISNQGVLKSTSRDLDLAIVGDGFFEVSPDFAVSGDVFFTRDGSFRIGTVNDISVPGAGYTATTPVAFDSNGVQTNPVTTKDGYLIDKNGYYVLGWAANADGTFPNSGTPAPMRIDGYAFTDTFTPSTTAALHLNLPSEAGVISDHAATVLAANNGTNNPDLFTYTASLVDSIGAKQTARINMTKSAANQWEMSATTTRASSPQTDTIVIGGTVDVGDKYSVTVDGTTVTYTTAATDTTLANVRDGLLAAINGDATIAASITATAGTSNGEITLTANAAATSFTTSATTTNGPSTAQVDTITVGGTKEAGDQYTIDVGGNSVTYTVLAGDADMDAVRDKLVALVNADASLNTTVIAAAGAGAGELTLSAITAGASFTSTVSIPVNGATADNTVTKTTTTPNARATDDSGVTVGTTTATQTSAISPVTFTPSGVVSGTPPNIVNFTLNYDNGGTNTLALDISDLTQFGSGFVPFSYNHDGLASATMSKINFDDSGHVIGTFDDGTQRKIYKIPLAKFANPNGLEMKNGMVFAESAESGNATLFAADESGIASFNPFSVELSNVDLAHEFSRMIMVQNAYNSNATVFRTVDEMTTVARDLKA